MVGDGTALGEAPTPPPGEALPLRLAAALPRAVSEPVGDGVAVGVATFADAVAPPPGGDKDGGAEGDAVPEGDAVFAAEGGGEALPVGDGDADAPDVAVAESFDVALLLPLSDGAVGEGGAVATVERVALPPPPVGRAVALADAVGELLGVSRAEIDGEAVAEPAFLPPPPPPPPLGDAPLLLDAHADTDTEYLPGVGDEELVRPPPLPLFAALTVAAAE